MLSLVCKVQEVEAIHTPPPPSLLIWVLSMGKVPSGKFSSPIKLSLSGDCYLSELLLPTFDQSMRCLDLEQMVLLFFALCWLSHCMQEVLAQW